MNTQISTRKSINGQYVEKINMAGISGLYGTDIMENTKNVGNLIQDVFMSSPYATSRQCKGKLEKLLKNTGTKHTESDLSI